MNTKRVDTLAKALQDLDVMVTRVEDGEFDLLDLRALRDSATALGAAIEMAIAREERTVTADLEALEKAQQ